MSDRHDPLEAAFDALRADTQGLDIMEPLNKVKSPKNFRPPALILGTAVTALVVLLGFVFLRDGGGDDLVAGTDSASSGSDGEIEGGHDSLVDSSWTLVSGSGPDGDVPIVDGWPITLTFDESTLGGTAACNGYGGSYSIDGETITLDEVGHNDMGCEPAVSESQNIFFAALLDVNRVTVTDGNLILSGTSTELTFAVEAPVPVADLVDQLWLLDTLIQGEAASTVSGDPATLLLSGDGTITGGTGCRSLSGEYVISGASVQFTTFGASGDCPRDLQTQDGAVVGVLGDGFTVEVDGQRLLVMSAGNEGLGYRAITEEELEELSASPGAPDTDPISVSALLDVRPADAVNVTGTALASGDGWIICEQLRTDGFEGCGGRWVTVSNFDPDLDNVDEGTWAGSLTYDDRFAIFGRDPQTEPNDHELTVATELAANLLEGTTVDTFPLALADTVLIGLGDQLLVERSSTELATASAWELNLEPFRGRTGPYSALDLLAQTGETEIIVGPHDHCAAPPAAISPEISFASHLSIQRTGIDSCLDWFTVDLFFDSSGSVVAITLDLWEP